MVSSFNITTPLTQCSNVTFAWRGGVAPYEILLVPTGHLTPEVRTIINYQNITGSPSPDDASVLEFSFPLTFPANSSFVAILSDAGYGAGSGGTSDILTVEVPEDGKEISSCLATKQVKPEFYFFLDTLTPKQCTPWEIEWPANLTTTPSSADEPEFSLWAVVPGQDTFAVPLPSSTDPTDSSLDCSSWTVDLKEGTEVMLVAGYEYPASATSPAMRKYVNGRGKGGSTDILTVGSSSSSSCLVNDPPPTTAWPTSTPTTLSAPVTTSTGANGKPLGATGHGNAFARVSSPTSSLALIAVGVSCLLWSMT